jgi:low affinity Fe/Cu permease
MNGGKLIFRSDPLTDSSAVLAGLPRSGSTLQWKRSGWTIIPTPQIIIIGARKCAGRLMRRRPRDESKLADGRLRYALFEFGGMFSRLASQTTAQISGKPVTFLVAVVTVAVWGITGPVFKYSDTWQLVINTGTTIVTFLMVFLIQNTQTRDTMALQLKLDELIIATKGARNAIVGIEDASDEDISEEKKQNKRRASD